MKKLSESFIDDIINRSRTGEERKEDDIDLLDVDGLYEYLQKRYKCVDPKTSIKKTHIISSNDEILISLPITFNRLKAPGDMYGIPRWMNIRFNESVNKISYIAIPKSIPRYTEILKDYNLESLFYSNDIITVSKNGKKTNKICIDIIDTLIDNVREPALIRKENVSESFIDDVIRRSRTGEERKEDNIDDFNCEEFSEYLKTYYIVNSKHAISYMRNSDTTDRMTIYMDKHGYCWIDAVYDKDKLWFLKVSPLSFIDNHLPKFKDELKKYFKINISDFDTAIEITSEKSNKDIIKLINLIIDFYPDTFFKKKLSESFIDDVISRSRNDEERKEDNVDLLDKEGFYKYLLKRYKKLGEFDINSWHANFIEVPVIDNGDNSAYVVALNYDVFDRPANMTVSSRLLDDHPDIHKLLKTATIIQQGRKQTVCNIVSYRMYIYPKDGEVSNSFFLTVIDTILNNTDKPMLKKI